jgi:hypothetical protein
MSRVPYSVQETEAANAAWDYPAPENPRLARGVKSSVHALVQRSVSLIAALQHRGVHHTI